MTLRFSAFRSFCCSARALLVASGLLTVPLATTAHARGDPQQEARIAECIRQAAGGRAWLERTLWGLRDQEGGWIGAQVRNTNGSHDLGPLQINSWWVPKIAAMVGRPQAHVRAWLTLDPCFNAGAARWIFLSALHSSGDYWKAVGIYHSPTTWRQRRYAFSVGRHLQKRFGRDVFTVTDTSVIHTANGRSQVGSGPTLPIENGDEGRVFGFGVLHQ